MASWDLRNLMLNLQDVGVLDVLLPFLLIFTIVFAVLQKTKLLGKDDDGKPRKNFNVIIALVLALATVIPHVTGQYPYDADVVNIINTALPNVSLLVIIIVMVLLTIGVFGKELDIGGSSMGGWFVLLAFVVIGFIFAAAANLFDRALMPSWLYFLYDSQFQALIITILVFGLIIMFITKEDKPKDDKKPGTIENLSKLLKDAK